MFYISKTLFDSLEETNSFGFSPHNVVESKLNFTGRVNLEHND